MKKFKRKYSTGVQILNNNTEDYSSIYNYNASKNSTNNAILDGVGTAYPVVGAFTKIGQTIGSNTVNDKGLYKNKANEWADNNFNPTKGFQNFGSLFEKDGLSFDNIANIATQGLLGESLDQKNLKEKIKNIKAANRVKNLNKVIDSGSATDAQSFLAKKGKYKVKSRIIETEGREPIFSPKKKDGTRDLLYFNPQDPTHSEGGVKAQVVSKEKTKYKCGTSKMKYGDGAKKLNAPSKPTTQDSLEVYNSAIALENHYNKLIPKYYPGKRLIIPEKIPFNLDNIKNESLQTYRNQFKNIFGPESDTDIDFKTYKNAYPNKTKQDYIKDLAASMKATKSSTKDKIYYKDLYPSKIDPKAPNTLFNKKIKPQGTVEYIWNEFNKKNKNMENYPPGGSITALAYYDPIAVKPVSMLTPEERKIREKKYGLINKDVKPKQPYILKKEKPKPIVDTRVKTNIEPLTTKQVPINLTNDLTINTPTPVKIDSTPIKKGSKFAQYPNMKKQLKYKQSANRMVNAKPVNNIVNTFAKGTSALVIPEGSSIITAEGGKNIQALKAYKSGNFKQLDKIINSMPEDKGAKAKDGKKRTKYKSPYGKEMSGEETKKLYDMSDEELSSKYSPDSTTYKVEMGRRKANLYGKSLYNTGRKNKRGELLAYKGATNNSTLTPKTLVGNSNVNTPALKTSTNLPQTGYTGQDLKSINTNTGKDLNKGFNMSSIPAIAEIAARQALLNKGVDTVPENYVSFKKYKYASQLDKTLNENMMASNTAKKEVRDMSGGNTGTYLSLLNNISSNRIKNNNNAVITDTLARQEILNKNVDVANNEEKINVGLKNEFNDKKAQNLGAYNNQLIAQGASIDSTLDSMRKESWAKKRDKQLLDVLKTKNYNYNEDSGITLGKKGLKKIKYRTTRK